MKWWYKRQHTGRQPKLMEGQQGYVFRRSRTLTGTTSSRVSTTAEAKGQLKTQRLKAHERRAKIIRYIRIVAFWVVVVFIVIFLFTIYVKVPAINLADPSTGANPAMSRYEQTVNSYLTAYPAQRFVVALDQRALEEKIKQAHSEILSLKVEHNWAGSDVSFVIGFRKPVLFWQTAGQKFYVDAQGVAFSYNHFTEPTVVVNDESGISPDASGGAVASSRFIRFLGQIVGAINSYEKGKVASVTIPRSTRQIDIKLEGRDYPIKTHSDRDPIEQAEDIANALKYFDDKGIKPEYIDVRVPHKAFYR